MGVIMLKFSDGVNIETSGKLRTLKLDDGWYVTGQGLLIPCGSHEEAKKKLDELKNKREKS